MGDARSLLVTGGLGAGKTTIAMEIGFVLDEWGISSGILDVDWLGWVGEGVTDLTDLLADNVAAVTSRMQRSGVERFVLARSIIGPEDVDWLGGAVPGELSVVALDVDREIARERVRNRDVGATTEHDLAQVDERADGAAFVDLRVPNVDRAVRETALEVLRLAGWDRD